jgi:hypothetical protein
MAGLSFEQKIELLRRKHPDKDPHQAFDLLSPTINDRLTLEAVRRELERLGFVDVVQTVRSGEIYVRARRPHFSALDRLRVGAVSKSLFISHYEEVERSRRDRVYERCFWDKAYKILGPKSAPHSITHVLGRLDLRAAEFGGKNVLVTCPDSLAPAKAAGDEVRPEVSSLLDDPSGLENYDLVLALGSAVSITRHPDVAVRHLAARLAPGGTVVIETLLPEPETLAHRMRRVALKPFAFERKIEILLRRHPEEGLEGNFSRLSPGLPIRLTEAALRSMLEDAGLREIVLVAGGRRLTATARMQARASRGEP